jgi:hypothetical protein
MRNNALLANWIEHGYAIKTDGHLDWKWSQYAEDNLPEYVRVLLIHTLMGSQYYNIEEVFSRYGFNTDGTAM